MDEHKVIRRNDLTGREFDRLKVLEFSHTDKYRAAYWHCVCKCGVKPAPIRGSYLTGGHVVSCGCARADSEVRSRARRAGKQA